MAFKETDISKICDALSDPNRIKLVTLLLEGGKSANTLLTKMPFSQPTLSHHLSILCDANVLNSKRDGKSIIYTVNRETMFRVSDFFTSLSDARTEFVPQTVKVTVPKAARKKVTVSVPKPEPVRSEEPVSAPAVKPQEPEIKVRVQEDFDLLD